MECCWAKLLKSSILKSLTFFSDKPVVAVRSAAVVLLFKVPTQCRFALTFSTLSIYTSTKLWRESKTTVDTMAGDKSTQEDFHDNYCKLYPLFRQHNYGIGHILYSPTSDRAVPRSQQFPDNGIPRCCRFWLPAQKMQATDQ